MVYETNVMKTTHPVWSRPEPPAVGTTPADFRQHEAESEPRGGFTLRDRQEPGDDHLEDLSWTPGQVPNLSHTLQDASHFSTWAQEWLIPAGMNSAPFGLDESLAVF